MKKEKKKIRKIKNLFEGKYLTMEKKISKFPKGFFSESRNIISSDEALKDVVKINWENILKNRKNNNKQIVKLIKQNV